MDYRDVIKKHGIEVGEEFLMQVKGESATRLLCERHRLTYSGLEFYDSHLFQWTLYRGSNRVIDCIVGGEMVITKKETELEAAKRQLKELTAKVEELEAEARGGRVKRGDIYYCVDFDNQDVDEMTEIESSYDVSMFERGNYFVNKQDAEDCLEVLKEALTTFREERGL